MGVLFMSVEHQPETKNRRIKFGGKSRRRNPDIVLNIGETRRCVVIGCKLTLSGSDTADMRYRGEDKVTFIIRFTVAALV